MLALCVLKYCRDEWRLEGVMDYGVFRIAQYIKHRVHFEF